MRKLTRECVYPSPNGSFQSNLIILTNKGCFESRINKFTLLVCCGMKHSVGLCHSSSSVSQFPVISLYPVTSHVQCSVSKPANHSSFRNGMYHNVCSYWTHRAQFISDKHGVSITSDHPVDNGKLHLDVECTQEVFIFVALSFVNG